ncbi:MULTISPECIES: hypothetical protein [unclassified Bradyrhizobium]|uniref:hypothetical protein n=1 Tax=unclassified Bradyrhizobium TaxID=2631580 RepID=UPI0020B24243|nr:MULTISPECIES: hypothetical protein [unclassified Bradyrhizobium]MCP3380499.1 hypothetical protein [Bradyrhizobium sp. CCGUVB4N]MCP3441365.1 hypothetical protein [Bradyrhizobium sp. CCGUVB14]
MHEWRSFQLNTLPTYVLGIEYSIVTPVADYSLPNNCGRSKEDEQERAKKIWAGCFAPQDRIKYIRKKRSQFEFRDISQMMDVVRGRCFTGCASELVNWRNRFRARAWRVVLLFCLATWLAIVFAVVRAVS